MRRQTSRRDFLMNTTLAGVGFWVAGKSLLAQSKSPNEKLNIGIIGAGGKGLSDMEAVEKSDNIVALCDVDEKQAAKAREKQPQAKFYHDYRKLLEEEKSLDAVIVATPDHTHAPASLLAMKLGKHVYCQKPLTHDVYEARQMREAAAKYKVATQMGNQGSAESGLREAVEVIQSGALGPVHEVHVWSNRPIWPQGLDRPSNEYGPCNSPIPSTLKWDLWLGTALRRPYVDDAYCPFKWRGWWDFVTGALGDMACHTANMPFRALKLEYPTSIEAESSGPTAESPPKWSIIRFEFPARGSLPPVKLTWYDGGKKPSEEVTKGLKLIDFRGGRKRKKPEKIEEGQTIPVSGCLVVGKEGMLFSPDDYGSKYFLFPEEKYGDFKPPAPSIPRSPGHYVEWIQAIKGGPPAYSNFDFAALLTETILLGNLAVRVGKRIEWDGPNMKSTNCPEAMKFVRREYSPGYSV